MVTRGLEPRWLVPTATLSEFLQGQIYVMHEVCGTREVYDLFDEGLGRRCQTVMHCATASFMGSRGSVSVKIAPRVPQGIASERETMRGVSASRDASSLEFDTRASIASSVSHLTSDGSARSQFVTTEKARRSLCNQGAGLEIALLPLSSIGNGPDDKLPASASGTNRRIAAAHHSVSCSGHKRTKSERRSTS